MHGSIACVAAALAPRQPGLQEPTRWAWGPWTIQKAAGIDGPDGEMPAPGAVFVRAPLAAAQTHTHADARTHNPPFQHARPFDAAAGCARVPARMPEWVHVSVWGCMRVCGCGCQRVSVFVCLRACACLCGCVRVLVRRCVCVGARRLSFCPCECLFVCAGLCVCVVVCVLVCAYVFRSVRIGVCVCLCVWRSCGCMRVPEAGAGVCGWRAFLPKRVVRRFVLIRRHRTERSSRTECRGTHGVLRGTRGVLLYRVPGGAWGVLKGYSRATQGY